MSASKIIDTGIRLYHGPRLVKGRKSRWTKRSYTREVLPGDPLYERAQFSVTEISWSDGIVIPWPKKNRRPRRRTSARK